jgi:hypothetical protein
MLILVTGTPTNRNTSPTNTAAGNGNSGGLLQPTNKPNAAGRASDIPVALLAVIAVVGVLL